MSESLIPVGSVVLPFPVPSGASDQDTAFVQQAFLSNLAELEEAKLAFARTTTPAVREFASWMISDHTAAVGTLSFIAQQLGVSLPTTLTTQQQAELNTLTLAPAQTFDADYAVAQVTDHVAAVNLFLQEAAGGQNPALLAYAQQLLPVLEQHLNGSEALAAQITGVQLQPTPITPAALPQSGVPVGVPNAQDVAFVSAASQSNILEILEGNLATQPNGNGAVMQFGRWMVTDHFALETALQGIAGQEGVPVPGSLGASQEQEFTALSTSTDGSFLQNYVSDQVIGHAQTIMTFLHEAESGQDLAIKAYAAENLPTLVQHLQGAIELESTVPSGSLATQFQIDVSLANLVASVSASGNSALTDYVNEVAGLQPGFGQFLASTLTASIPHI